MTEKVTKKFFAEKFDGREYSEELSRDEEKQLQDNNFVVVLGASDDLCIFVGAITAEIACVDSCRIYFDPDLKSIVSESNYYINAVFAPDWVDATWGYEANIPHEKFYIYEDEDIYCEGIVFNLNVVGFEGTMKHVIDSLGKSITDSQINFYKNLINEDFYEEIDNSHPENLYISAIQPYNDFLKGLIRAEIMNDDDIVVIYSNYNFIKEHFSHWIEQIEGPICYVDKAGMILRGLVNYYKNNEEINFDYTNKYTYNLPETVFTNHNEILEFYDGIKGLIYGNPKKYLEECKKLENYENNNR